MKKILGLLRNLILAPFIIYIYNLIAAPLNLIIPINLITVLIIAFLGIPGLVLLLTFLLIAF